MSTSDGQTGSAAVFNAAYTSRTATSGNNIDGLVDLTNSDSASIANITNIQKFMNQESTNFRVVQTVTAGGTITVDERIKNHIVLVVGDAGNVTTSATPFTAENAGSFLDGTIITVIGTDDTQQVTIAHNETPLVDETIQNGTIALDKFRNITYMRVTVSGTGYWLQRI